MQKYLHIIKSIETLKNKTIGYLKDIGLKNVKRTTINSQTNGLEAAQEGLSAGERESSLNLTCQTRMPKYISPSNIIMLIIIGI